MDLDLVEALARLALQARREGWELQIDDPPPDVSALLELCGLREALGLEPPGAP